MTALGLLLIGIFLPLFPLSMGFNALLERVTQPLLRSVLLLAWPQVGLWALSRTFSCQVVTRGYQSPGASMSPRQRGRMCRCRWRTVCPASSPSWIDQFTPVERLGPGGMALGVLQGIKLEERIISLEPGDYLVFYTDGITEAFSLEDEIFGDERLEATIQAAGDVSAQAMLRAIDNSVSAFVGDNPASDDVTLMVLHRSSTSDSDLTIHKC